jgi:hypothetical protein
MFVPSLSWQIFVFQYKMAYKTTFPHRRNGRSVADIPNLKATLTHQSEERQRRPRTVGTAAALVITGGGHGFEALVGGGPQHDRAWLALQKHVFFSTFTMSVPSLCW